MQTTIWIDGQKYDLYDKNITSDEKALAGFSGYMSFSGSLSEEVLTKMADRYESELKNLSRVAGGKYISITSSKDINSFFSEINSNFSSAYFIKTEQNEVSFYFILASVILIISSWIIARMIIGVVNV